jgi:AcrR family transcriptional regulator
MVIDQSQESSAPQRESYRRLQRAHRILDAAAALILRWGYNKTTIDDIARHAGVAKGTIYLHWKTREDLFAALMKREKAELVDDLKRRIEADPAGATLRGLFKHSALALMQRPLMKAVLVSDLEVIGKLAHGEHGGAAVLERAASFTSYLEFLRAHNLVRTDLSVTAQVYMLSAIFMGFFLVVPLLPDALTPADEQRAELMAETAHRALEVDQAASPDALQSVSDAFMRYLNQSVAVAHQQFQQALGA